MGYKVGIYDKDVNYVRNVMTYVNRYGSTKVRMAAFSNINALEEYIRENLLDLIILGEQVKISDDVPVVFICDKREELSEGDIYKYQSGEEILRIILRVLKSNSFSNPKESFVYGVYSPLGRCGKTTLSLGLCNYYKKSIYIGLESCSWVCEDSSIPRDIGERFIYYLANKDDQILGLLNSVDMGERDFKLIVSESFVDDIIQLSAENISWFCDIIKKNMSFSRVVFDLGVECLGDIKILEVLDRVYMPILNDKNSLVKLNKFSHMLDIRGLNHLNKKIVHVEVPSCEFNSDKILALIRNGDL